MGANERMRDGGVVCSSPPPPAPFALVGETVNRSVVFSSMGLLSKDETLLLYVNNHK